MGIAKRIWGIGALGCAATMAWGQPVDRGEASEPAGPLEIDGIRVRDSREPSSRSLWEMNWENGKAVVTKRGKEWDEGAVKFEHIRALVNQEEKSIVWLDSVGRIEQEKKLDTKGQVMVSRNGAYYGIYHKYDDSTDESIRVRFQYFDKSGAELWDDSIGNIISISPTGETIMSGDPYEGFFFEFYNRLGLVKELEERHVLFEPSLYFSNGDSVACIKHGTSHMSIVLFNKKGEVVWEALKEKYGINYISQISVSPSGDYISAYIYHGKSKKGTLTTLNKKGETTWETPVERVKTILHNGVVA